VALFLSACERYFEIDRAQKRHPDRSDEASKLRALPSGIGTAAMFGVWGCQRGLQDVRSKMRDTVFAHDPAGLAQVPLIEEARGGNGPNKPGAPTATISTYLLVGATLPVAGKGIPAADMFVGAALAPLSVSLCALTAHPAVRALAEAAVLPKEAVAHGVRPPRRVCRDADSAHDPGRVRPSVEHGADELHIAHGVRSIPVGKGEVIAGVVISVDIECGNPTAIAYSIGCRRDNYRLTQQQRQQQ